MGKIYSTFGHQHYNNENEVEQKFITPFLKRFLGYNTSNLLYKRRYKLRDGFTLKEVVYNRNKKIKIQNLEGEPDVIVVNDKEWGSIFYKSFQNGGKHDDKAIFIIEAKSEKTKLPKFLEQKNAYCMGVHTNEP